MIRQRHKLMSSVAITPFASGIDLVKHGITDPENQFVDRHIASQVLGMKPQTLACWASTKRYGLPVYKVGRKARYKVSDLLAFLENGRIG